MLYLFVLQDNTAANLSLLLLCTLCALCCIDLLIANASVHIIIDGSSTSIKHSRRLIAIENVTIALLSSQRTDN